MSNSRSLDTLIAKSREEVENHEKTRIALRDEALRHVEGYRQQLYVAAADMVVAQLLLDYYGAAATEAFRPCTFAEWLLEQSYSNKLYAHQTIINLERCNNHILDLISKKLPVKAVVTGRDHPLEPTSLRFEEKSSS